MKLFNRISSLGRKGKLAVALLALSTGIAIVPVVNAEFYPARPTYDYNKYDASKQDCTDATNPAAQNGRCGSLNGPVFNSFVNTPSYGDERPFFDGRRTDEATSTVQDPITSVNAGSHEVILRMYVHNNANQATDCLPVHLNANGVCTQIDNNAKGIAHNTKVRILLPTGTDNLLRSRAYITADNAAQVEDTVDLTGTQNFNLSYIPGSAKLLRGTDSYQLSDSIVGSGALIGNKQMDGNLPGCFDYAALVEIHVRVNTQETPKLQITKQVKVNGSSNWTKQVTVSPGADVKWLLSTRDISNANLNNVVIRDVLPPHVTLVPGSVHLVNSQGDKVQADSPLFAGGFNAGNYTPGATQYVTFETIAHDDFPQCSLSIRNVAHARSDQTPIEASDYADVTITKQNCTPPQALTCDMLSGTVGDNRNVTFTAKASVVGGAEITSYKYDFGDSSATLLTNKTEVTHTYTDTAAHVAHLYVLGTVNGKMQTVTASTCAVVINATKPTVPGQTPTPGQPTALVNTGAGSTFSIFAAVSGFSALGYRWILGRRLSA